MNNLNNLSSLQAKELLATETARRGFAEFCVAIDPKYQLNWHHKAVAKKLEEVYLRVLKGESPRVMLFEPPRHGKSDQATQKFPAWVLGKSPEFPIVVSSYSSDLATDFGQGTRDIMSLPFYRKIFNTRLREDTTAKAKWMTDKKGGYTAVGVGGPITGRGFKIGIFDDPFKNDEEAESDVMREKVFQYFNTTFYTRQEGNAAIILIMTRWHEDDIAGRLLAKQEEDRKSGALNYDKWEVLSFKAIADSDEPNRKQGEALWPAKFDVPALEHYERQLGPYKWSALYQQEPVDAASQEFKKDWLHYCSWEDVLKKSTRRFCTIDPALKKSDEGDYCGFTVNFVDAANNWHIKAWHERMRADELIERMFQLRRDYNIEKFGIEEGQYKEALQPFLDKEMRKRNAFMQVEELKHRQTLKETRIRGLLPRYASGSVYHIISECNDLEQEMLRFPKGAHDDVLDACAYQEQIAEAAPSIFEDEDMELYNQSFT